MLSFQARLPTPNILVPPSESLIAIQDQLRSVAYDRKMNIALFSKYGRVLVSVSIVIYNH